MDAESQKQEMSEKDRDSLQDILIKLDISDIPKPDRQIGDDEDDEDEGSDQAAPLSGCSSVTGAEHEDTADDRESADPDGKKVTLKQAEVRLEEANGNAVPMAEACTDSDVETLSKKQGGKNNGDEKTQRKSISPLKLLKRLTSKEKKEKKKTINLDKLIMEVKVDSLPQTFIVKYMGVKEVFDLWGIQHTRGPLEELVAEIQEKTKHDEWEDLPLLVMRVSQRGLQLKEHKANTSKVKITNVIVPIEFVSYGVQDIKYTRVFSFILVKEISSRAKRLECHSYVCDSTITTRRLALSVSLAFKEYASTLRGKPYKFQVDLRSTKELEQDLSSKLIGDECEV